ncbi:MAG: hypothetical protein ABI760_10280 [Ferruginibacter sp.]
MSRIFIISSYRPGRDCRPCLQASKSRKALSTRFLAVRTWQTKLIMTGVGGCLEANCRSRVKGLDAAILPGT